MGLFTRKKKTGQTIDLRLINEYKDPFTSFGFNIEKSDVVKICIDRVASQCAKLNEYT